MIGLIAVVIFEVVNTPLRKGLRVVEFVLKAARVSATGVSTRTRINSKFQPFGVNIIRDCFNTVRKLIAVGNEPAVRAALLFAPAVVDNDVFITSLAQTLRFKRVRGGLYQFLVYLPCKGVP